MHRSTFENDGLRFATPHHFFIVFDCLELLKKRSVSLVGKLGLIGRSIKTPVHPELW
jgi:hypothetical protein